MATFAITTLTPAAIQQSLQNDGLTTLGLTALTLSPRWSTQALGAYSATQLTLTVNGDIQAPFLGLRRHAFDPVSDTLAADIGPDDVNLTIGANANNFPTPAGGGAIFLTLSNGSGTKREVVSCTARNGTGLTVVRGMDNTAKQSFSTGDTVTVNLKGFLRTADYLDVNGVPLTGASTVLELHPQAALRLERVMAARYAAAGTPALRPVPWCMVVHGAEGYLSAQRFEADEVMTNITGAISFHDGRGQIVDPIFVAAVFDDLLTAFPGLKVANSGATNAVGGIQNIKGMATGRLIHFVDMHGGPFRAALPAATMVTQDAGNTPTDVPATGLVSPLQAGHTITAAATDQGRLRWGFAIAGTLARTALNPPAPAARALPRDFFRVAVVDTVFALLGNRTGAEVLGVKPSDNRIPPELLPTVRDQVTINYLVDGMDTLAAATGVLNRPQQQMIMAVSSDIERQLLTPAAPGVNARWPIFPPNNTGVGFPAAPALVPGTNVAAAYINTNDVVVTFTQGIVPNGATVRIFPQVFVEIPAINADEPSFLRGDGGSNIADASGTVAVFLPNPFSLVQGQNKPTTLTMDVVIAPRAGTRVIFGAIAVPVGPGPAQPANDPFLNAGTILNALDARFQSIAPSPLFGIPTTFTPPAPAQPQNFINLALSMLFDDPPRQAARLPTMARFDTLIVTGTTPAVPPNPVGPLDWEAVVTGAHWSKESRSAQHASANPGNPAAHDIHAPGVHVSGALAYDVAVRALKRVQPLLPAPIPSNPNAPPYLGWLALADGNNFNPPADTNAANTSIGVLLETVAISCETSLLGSINPPPQGQTVQQILNQAATALNLPQAPTVTIQNEARMQREFRRECFVAKHGFRDAQWSLLRAIGDARELVYIESPQFAFTARGADADYKAELVAALASRLSTFKNLRVIICTPRETDFAPRFKGWSRQHYKDRTDAVTALTAVAAGRVAVFHSVGFPGRPAYIRTTSVIVDDVWSLTGSTHFRRRGMTFDGSTAVASFDRQMDQGYSLKVRAFRRGLMAAKIGVTPPAVGATPPSDWVRLGRPASAFDLIADLLAQGGLGRIQPLWPGPADTTIQPVGFDVSDPDGSTEEQTFVTTLAGMLNEAGD